MPFAAAIFDLDGTLVDSEMLWIEAMRKALASRQVHLADEELEILVYGRAWTDIYRDIEKRSPGLFKNRQEAEQLTEPIFNTLCRTRNVSIDTSVELLRRLARHMPLMIVSGSTRSMIEHFVDILDIRQCVCDFLGCEDYSPGKPDPAGFVLAAERLGVPPDQCVVFEDSQAGVTAAKRAGMTCVALQQRDRPGQDVSHADLVVANLLDAAHVVLAY